MTETSALRLERSSSARFRLHTPPRSADSTPGDFSSGDQPTRCPVSFATKISLMCFSLVLGTGVSTGIVAFRNSARTLNDRAQAQLQHEAQLAANHLSAGMGAISHDVNFLARTPPIEGMLRARAAGGIDPLDGSSEEEWRTRLAAIFRALLESRPDYSQVRFIGVSDGGRELVLK